MSMASVDCAAYNLINVHREDKQQILMFAVYWGSHLSVSLEEEKKWWKLKSTAKMKQKLQASITIKKPFFFSFYLWFSGKILLLVFDFTPSLLQKPLNLSDALTGGRDWSNQVTYQGILKEFLKNIHIFWKKMMHQNVARAHEEDYSALFHA